MKVKELIGRLNSYNMDAEVLLTTHDDKAGELDLTIESGAYIDEGNTSTLAIKIVEKPVEEAPAEPPVEPESV